MSYRLKRKRFNCDGCVREWNQLVGGDIDSVMCDICSLPSKVINHDVPTKPKAAASTTESPIKTTSGAAAKDRIHKTPQQASSTSGGQDNSPSWERNLRGVFSGNRGQSHARQTNTEQQQTASRRGFRSQQPTTSTAHAQESRQAYGLGDPGTSNNNEETKTNARGSENLRDGAYRMVFSKTKNSHHNRMNLRDTSSEPTNLYGDQNLPRTTNSQNNAGANNDDDDLNDRATGGLSRMPSDLPDLETAHVPHRERKARAAASKSKDKHKPNESAQASNLRGTRSSLYQQAAANVIRPPQASSNTTNANEPSMQAQETRAPQSNLQDRASRQGNRGERRPTSRYQRPESGTRRNIRFTHSSTMPAHELGGAGTSPFLQELFRQASNATDATGTTQPNTSSNNAGSSDADRRTSFTTTLRNININLNHANSSQEESKGGLPQMNAQQRNERAQNSRQGAREERKAGDARPRFQRAQSEQVGADASPFADIFSRLAQTMAQNPGGAATTDSAANPNGAANRQNPHRDTMAGIRARSTTFRTANGNVVSVVNIGVPSDHPLAAAGSMAGPSGLHNVRVGGIEMPAPQFVVVNRPDGEGEGNGTSSTNANSGGDQPGQQQEGSRVGASIETLVNDLLRNFMDVFSGREFLRMQMQYNEFNPNNFMSNFNSNFASDDLFEMIRRMSEQEAQQRQRKKRAKKSAVDKLPIVEIENKHCKKKGSQLEPPCCTVCCDNIEVKSKGMFMPCGHIYHPDCLKPWLEQNNTCPVCRFDLPIEEEEATAASQAT